MPSFNSDWSFDFLVMTSLPSPHLISPTSSVLKPEDHGSSLSLIPFGRRDPSFGCRKSPLVHDIDSQLL